MCIGRCLPVGWLQRASVLDFVRDCPTGALILLDELDRYLGPSLQRAMLELIAREAAPFVRGKVRKR